MNMLSRSSFENLSVQRELYVAAVTALQSSLRMVCASCQLSIDCIHHLLQGKSRYQLRFKDSMGSLTAKRKPQATNLLLAFHHLSVSTRCCRANALRECCHPKTASNSSSRSSSYEAFAAEGGELQTFQFTSGKVLQISRVLSRPLGWC